MSKYRERNPSPQNDKRACMCKDGTYSRKCCNGSYQAQGIGNITGESMTGVWNGYLITACSNGHTHHVHIHNTTLTVGKTYYLSLENNHNECYTITSTHHSEGIHINSASIIYDDCVECEAAN
jgi:hypothetical protein